MANRRKPFSFNTTLRNPGRIIAFLKVISKFEGEILDYDLVIRIEAEFINSKIYKPGRNTMGVYKKHQKTTHGEFVPDDESPMASNKVETIFDKWNKNDPNTCGIDEIMYLLKNTCTAHKEKGYEMGWPSRFYTQISMLNEFGFTYIDRNNPILISENGKLLLSKLCINDNGEVIKNVNYSSKNVSNEIVSDESYSAYLIALSKYQTNNPWRHNTVQINFLKLVLQTILYLDEKYKFKGINRKAISFIISWGNSDYKKLAEVIYQFQKEYTEKGYDTPALLYAYAMNLFDTDTPDYSKASENFIKSKGKDYKDDKLLKETPDEVIRKLRLSELISLRGNGFRLDVNTAEMDKINYIINNVSNVSYFESKKEYFNYMGEISHELLFFNSYSNEEVHNLENIKLKKLQELSERLSWDKLQSEMDTAAGSKVSSDLLFKDIPSYVCMEFLSAIVTKKALPDANVVPRYKTDDEGIAIQCASGSSKNSPGEDIDVYSDDTQMILEPTIANSRSFQVEHEIPSIANHYRQIKNENVKKNVFSVFLAKKIVKPDVGDIIGYFNERVHCNIYAWEIKDYINVSKKIRSIDDYEQLNSYSKPMDV